MDVGMGGMEVNWRYKGEQAADGLRRLLYSVLIFSIIIFFG